MIDWLNGLSRGGADVDADARGTLAVAAVIDAACRAGLDVPAALVGYLEGAEARIGATVSGMLVLAETDAAHPASISHEVVH